MMEKIKAILANKRQRTVVIFVAMPLTMLGLSFAFVPFYNWFCSVTGFGGTTQVAETKDVTTTDIPITVRFDASTAADMPWQFKPQQYKMDVNLGETGLAFYEAANPTDDIIVGTASYNVEPKDAGFYFNKIECFCFTEQTLQPGESVDMPVTFYVDPSILDNPDAKFIKSITLSYTFHVTERIAASEDLTAAENTLEEHIIDSNS